MSKLNWWQIKEIKQRMRDELVREFNLPNYSGIYIFRRFVEEGEVDSKGNVKTWTQEAYIGQAKNILERCVSHYMPFSHDHLAISLSKYKNWEIITASCPIEQLDQKEKETIENWKEINNMLLFNNSSGGQGSSRGKHLENSDFKIKVQEKKMSVENRAKKKLESHMKKVSKWQDYFEVMFELDDTKDFEFEAIRIIPKRKAKTKDGRLTVIAKKVMNDILLKKVLNIDMDAIAKQVEKENSKPEGEK